MDALNQTMKEIQARRAGTMAVNKLRGVRPKKQEVPAILSLFNKVVGKPAQPTKRFRYQGRIKKVAEKYQGPLSNQSPDDLSKKMRGQTSETLVTIPTESTDKTHDPLSDGSRAELSEYEMDDVEIERRASSGLSISPTQSKVDFKLPSIVE